MGYVALIVVGAFALGVCALLAQIMRHRERSWERKEHAWETERRDLLNRIMYLTDRPWSHPADERPVLPTTIEEMMIYAEQDVLE